MVGALKNTEIMKEMYEMLSFTCPNCGATMELDEPRDTLFCAYCGQKVLIDHRTRKVRIEKNININQTINKNVNKNIRQHIIDEAEIERQKTARVDSIGVWIVLGIFFLGTFIALILHG